MPKLSERIKALAIECQQRLQPWNVSEILEAFAKDAEALETTNQGMHESYLRIRALVPDSFKTPHAPTNEQVWATTEAAIQALVDDYNDMSSRD